MSIEQSWEDAPYNQEQSAEEWYPEPIPVVVHNEQVQETAPEYVSLIAYPVIQAGTGQATQILPHRYHRHKAKFTFTLPANTTLWLSNNRDNISGPNPSVLVFNVAAGAAALVNPLPEYEAMQPLYMAWTGTGPVTVSVMDESYGTVQ